MASVKDYEEDGNSTEEGEHREQSLFIEESSPQTEELEPLAVTPPANDAPPPESSGTSRPPLCGKCRYHGLENPIKGHKKICPFKDCACEKGCYLNSRRQALQKQHSQLQVELGMNVNNNNNNVAREKGPSAKKSKSSSTNKTDAKKRKSGGKTKPSVDQAQPYQMNSYGPYPSRGMAPAAAASAASAASTFMDPFPTTPRYGSYVTPAMSAAGIGEMPMLQHQSTVLNNQGQQAAVLNHNYNVGTYPVYPTPTNWIYEAAAATTAGPAPPASTNTNEANARSQWQPSGVFSFLPFQQQK